MSRKYAGPLRPGERSAYVPGTRRNVSTFSRRPRKPKTQSQKNKKSIEKIKKQNMGGVFQRNFQIARFGQYTFSKEKPLCFALNDFTSSLPDDLTGGQIYAPNYLASGGLYTTSAGIVANWYTANPAEQNFTYNLTQPYRQWTDQNDATVSPVQYMPLSADYHITFTRPTQDSAQPAVSIRIDVISTRRTYLKSQYHDYTMPECIGAFQNMAVSNEDGTKNAYNPALWSVRTRYITMPAINTGVNVVRNDQHKHMKMFERFKPKNIKLHLDTVSATQKEPFALAVDPDIIRWCIISIGDNPVAGSNSGVFIKMQRTIRYRDLDNKPL